MDRGRVLAVLLLVFLLGLTGTSAVGHAASTTQAPAFREVGTRLCSCGALSSAVGSVVAGLLPAVPAAPAPVYDEQLGISFTQDFTALAYNVTAVEQQDPVSGDGPAYLLNGVSSSGFWYQVGLSWNWNPGATPGTDFSMNYEVFNARGTSIFPTDGGGGLLALSGAVNQGDSVLLNLYFNSSAVVMLVHDWNTGATGTETFSSEDATAFMGTPSGNADSQGYFTGLMTEWYHPSPYMGNEAQVVFSEKTIALTSAWLWMDEFNPNARSGGGVFANVTASAVSFGSNGTQLHEFSSNGATEYASAFEFVTGSTGSGTMTVPLRLSYSVEGGGSGYEPPLLEYVSEGTDVNTTLTTSTVTYNIDEGSNWNVSSTLKGSTVDERWELGGPSFETVSGPQTFDIVYYHQFADPVAYSVVGAPGTAPLFSYVSLGKTESTQVGTSTGALWLDAGSMYSLSNPLNGPGQNERWEAASGVNGTVTSSVGVSATYYQQYSVTAQYGSTGGSPPPPMMNYTEFGLAVSTVLSSSPQDLWADAGSGYALPSMLGTGQQERWVANATSGTVGVATTVSALYQQQYYVSLQVSNSLAGNISRSTSGWYDAGSPLGVSVHANQGWNLEYWQGGNGTATPFPPGQVNGPMNETAVFYPGLTISAGNGDTVSYSYTDQGQETQGSVPPGHSVGIWAPPSGVTLVAKATSFLYSFTGWSGAASSANPSISLTLTAPETVTAGSSYNYPVLGILGGIAVVLIAVVASLARRGPKEKALGSPAA